MQRVLVCTLAINGHKVIINNPGVIKPCLIQGKPGHAASNGFVFVRVPCFGFQATGLCAVHVVPQPGQVFQNRLVFKGIGIGKGNSHGRGKCRIVIWCQFRYLFYFEHHLSLFQSDVWVVSILGNMQQVVFPAGNDNCRLAIIGSGQVIKLTFLLYGIDMVNTGLGECLPERVLQIHLVKVQIIIKTAKPFLEQAERFGLLGHDIQCAVHLVNVGQPGHSFHQLRIDAAGIDKPWYAKACQHRHITGEFRQSVYQVLDAVVKQVLVVHPVRLNVFALVTGSLQFRVFHFTGLRVHHIFRIIVRLLPFRFGNHL